MIDVKDFNDFVNKNYELIDGIKLTSLKNIGFNDMEGRQWQANYKILTLNGYKNKLLKVYFNDSYLDDNTPEEFAEYLTWM